MGAFIQKEMRLLLSSLPYSGLDEITLQKLSFFFHFKSYKMGKTMDFFFFFSLPSLTMLKHTHLMLDG